MSGGASFGFGGCWVGRFLPKNRLERELGLGNILGTYSGGNLAAASVPELRIFFFRATVCLSGCCLCVFPLWILNL